MQFKLNKTELNFTSEFENQLSVHQSAIKLNLERAQNSTILFRKEDIFVIEVFNSTAFADKVRS